MQEELKPVENIINGLYKTIKKLDDWEAERFLNIIQTFACMSKNEKEMIKKLLDQNKKET